MGPAIPDIAPPQKRLRALLEVVHPGSIPTPYNPIVNRANAVVFSTRSAIQYRSAVRERKPCKSG